MTTAIESMPSVSFDDSGSLEAWKDGRDAADRAYGRAEDSGELFSLVAAYVPIAYRDGDAYQSAYESGYADRADVLTGDAF